MDPLLIKSIATKVNKKVNIPFLSERTEQALFEAIIGATCEVLDDLVQAAITKK